jgi:hypothetical protein
VRDRQMTNAGVELRANHGDDDGLSAQAGGGCERVATVAATLHLQPLTAQLLVRLHTQPPPSHPAKPHPHPPHLASAQLGPNLRAKHQPPSEFPLRKLTAASLCACLARLC